MTADPMKPVTKLQTHKDLLSNMILRDIKARYKSSFLGYAWVILNPLVTMLVFSLVFSVVIRIPTGDTPYALFVYAGLLPWLYLANSLSTAAGSIVNETSLVSKTYFPREIFPIATTVARCVDFLLGIIVFFGFLIGFHYPFSWVFLFLPFVIFFQTLFILGIGLLLAAANLFFRDVQHLLTLILMLWMYLTPVIYPPELVPERFHWVFIVNPMATFVNMYRDMLLYQRIPDLLQWVVAGTAGIVFFVLGYLVFKKVEPYFADNL